MEEASGTSSKEGEKSKLQKIYSRLSLWKNKPTSPNSTIRPSTSSKSSSPRTSLPPKKSSLSLKKRCSQNEEHPKFSAEQQSLHYITDDSLPSPNIPIMPSKSYESSSGRISPQKIYPRLPRSSQNDGLLTTSILKNCSVSLDKMSITPTQQRYLDSLTGESVCPASNMLYAPNKPASCSKISSCMSAAERKRKSRAGRNEEIKEKEKERDRQRKAVNRALQTFSQRSERLMDQRQR